MRLLVSDYGNAILCLVLEIYDIFLPISVLIVAFDDEDTIESLAPPIWADELKDDQWMGVTVRSQGASGKVLVCAHRYIAIMGESRFGQGLCYVLSNDLKFDEIYEPCKGRSTAR